MPLQPLQRDDRSNFTLLSWTIVPRPNHRAGLLYWIRAPRPLDPCRQHRDVRHQVTIVSRAFRKCLMMQNL